MLTRGQAAEILHALRGLAAETVREVRDFALYPSRAARIVGHLTSRDWQEIQARLSLALAVR
jgi:hypothetical protein